MAPDSLYGGYSVHGRPGKGDARCSELHAGHSQLQWQTKLRNGTSRKLGSLWLPVSAWNPPMAESGFKSRKLAHDQTLNSKLP